MSSVSLQVPQEIVDELAMPYEGVRDLQAIVVAIDGVNVAASIVTLATLRPYARRFVEAVRYWRLRDNRATVVLTVTGPGLEIRLDLPRNIEPGELLEQLGPLFGRPSAQPPSLPSDSVDRR
jgi:hypothetical protein